MKKIIIFTMLSSFFSFTASAGPLLAERLTFSVDDVLSNAILENAKPEYSGKGPYDLVELQSDAGKKCIARAIIDLSNGKMPKGIAELYTDRYVFHNENCYTKAVIGHFCGSTLQFENKLPIF
jgi:hypothetical protein